MQDCRTCCKSSDTSARTFIKLSSPLFSHIIIQNLDFQGGGLQWYTIISVQHPLLKWVRGLCAKMFYGASRLWASKVKVGSHHTVWYPSVCTEMREEEDSVNEWWWAFSAIFPCPWKSSMYLLIKEKNIVSNFCGDTLWKSMLRPSFGTRLLYSVLPAPYTRASLFDLVRAWVSDLERCIWASMGSLFQFLKFHENFGFLVLGNGSRHLWSIIGTESFERSFLKVRFCGRAKSTSTGSSWLVWREIGCFF